MRLLTVASPSSLTAAIALARSWHEVGSPGSPVTLVCTKDLPPPLGDSEFDECLDATSIGMPEELYGRLHTALGADELEWAIAPFALLRALEDAPSVVFVRPGGLFFSCVDNEVRSLGRGSVSLLKLRTRAQASAFSFVVGEALGDPFNHLSFAVISQDGRAWLEEWCAAVANLGLDISPEDARLDRRLFRPLLLDDRVAWHGAPSLSTSIWNLDERALSFVDSKPFVDGEEVGFLRLSELRNPEVLRRLKEDANPSVDRVLAEIGRLSVYYDEYDAVLHDVTSQVDASPPTDLVLSDSTVLNSQMRACYAAYLRDARSSDQPLPPYLAGDDRDFLEWATATIGPETDVTNWMVATWLVRPDLHGVVGDPLSVGNEYLAVWARTHGVAEGYIPERWIPSPKGKGVLLTSRSRKPTRKGCNVYGYTGSDLGLGQLARNLAQAVHVHDPSLDVIASHRNSSPPHLGDVMKPAPHGSGDVNIIVVNPDQFTRWIVDIGPSQLESRYNIAVWAWELETVPPTFQTALEYTDEVWAISDFVRDAITSVTTKPVFTLPVPVMAAPSTGGETLPELELLGGEPYFLFAFDFLSDYDRKNPEAAIQAHQVAFEERGPWLVIKCMNAHKRPLEASRLTELALRSQRVLLLDRPLTETELAHLRESSLGCVSLHRSEGFGLTIAESMLREKPVIATAYSGNLDFTNAQNSFLVEVQSQQVPATSAYVGGGSWGEPDVTQAAAHMRFIVEFPEEAALVARRGRHTIEQSYSIDAAVRFIEQRMLQIRQSTRRRRWRGLPRRS